MPTGDGSMVQGLGKLTFCLDTEGCGGGIHAWGHFLGTKIPLIHKHPATQAGRWFSTGQDQNNVLRGALQLSDLRRRKQRDSLGSVSVLGPFTSVLILSGHHMHCSHLRNSSLRYSSELTGQTQGAAPFSW